MKSPSTMRRGGTAEGGLWRLSHSEQKQNRLSPEDWLQVKLGLLREDRQCISRVR